jgi:hypothetical protein
VVVEHGIGRMELTVETKHRFEVLRASFTEHARTIPMPT